MRVLLILLLSAVVCSSQVFLSNGSIAQMRSSAVTRSTFPAPVYSLTLTFHGDSITRDLERTNYCFTVSSNFLVLKNLAVDFHQRGVNGISYNYRWPSEPYTNTMIQDAPISVDTYQRPGMTNWLVVFAGTNGILLGGHSAATEYADFKTYIAARIAAGWIGNHIVVVTCLPRTSMNETTRGTFNSSLAGDDGGYGYRLARVDQNTDIGEAGDNLNTTYYYDGTHPTAAGHDIIAGIVLAAMYP